MDRKMTANYVPILSILVMTHDQLLQFKNEVGNKYPGTNYSASDINLIQNQDFGRRKI